MDKRNIRIKKLLYQSWYRGCKETDRILGHFCKTHIYNFSDVEIDMLEEIMQESDSDIYNWVSGVVDLPVKYASNHVMKMIIDFDVAEASQL